MSARDASAQELHREALRRLNRGELAAAEECVRRLLQAAPQHADATFLSGVIAMERRELRRAAELLGRAVELRGDRCEYHAQLSRVLSLLGRTATALAVADRAAALNPSDALTWDTLGNVHARAGSHHRAAQMFRQATSLAPGHAGYQFNLAASLKFTGEFDAAEQAYEACIALDAHQWRAHPALAALRRWTPQHNHVERLQRLLGETDEPDAQLHLCHALAKELEDLGRYGESFRQLQLGKAKKRSVLHYSIDDDATVFRKLESLFDGVQPQDKGFPSAEPIFVIGMPRTGTTLVDRILSSHSQVHSAGELQNFAVALKRATGTRSAKVLDVETLDRSLGVDFHALGEAYLASTRPGTGHTRHFVDKMPLNFFYAGHIHLALPAARIICLRRDPLDTCLSNFRQLFAVNFSYYNYAYDLLDTGRYYAMFDRLMVHWRRVLPGKVLEVRYEDIVQSQEQTTRRLLEFCGLEWEEQCLTFERNEAPVATASAAQVREPLYSSSIGRWRRYGDALQELKALLAAEGVMGEDRVAE